MSKINDTFTILKLYGNSVLPEFSDLHTFRDIINASITSKPINKKGAFQRKTLHSSYRGQVSYHKVSPQKEILKSKMPKDLEEILSVPVKKSMSYTPHVSLPKFSTIITPSAEKREPPQILNIVTPAQSETGLSTEEQMNILSEMDFNRLRSLRSGRHTKTYNLNELKNYARRLGISSTGKRKIDLISDLLSLKEKMGM